MDRNNAQVTFPKATGFGQIMDRAIADYPDEEAMVCGKWRITYGEFGKLVNKTANMLRANGVTKGSTVAVVSRNSIEFMIADMAILKLGAISVKFSWRLSPKEMKYLFELNNVKWTFYRPETEEWAKEMYEYFEGRIQCFDLRVNGEESPIYAMTQEYSDEAVEVEVSGDDPAFHMHTSGTTGVPKCVVYTHESILRELESTLMSFHYVPGQVYQFVSQMFHSAGMGAYMVLSTGGKLIIKSCFSVDDYMRTLESEKVNAIGVVPIVLKSILDAQERGNYDLSNLKVINYSTCPISPDLLARAMSKLDCHFYQAYGMTEMASVVTVLLPEEHFIDDGAHLKSVGRPIFGADVKIVDEEGKECPVGVVGEILAKGPGMMKEYFGRPEQTQNVIRDGWYYTKDMGYLDDKGYLFICGRKDSLIISGGENIYPEEVSNVIQLLSDDVAEVCVYGVPDELWGEHVKASVVLAPGSKLTAEALTAFCRKHMPRFRVPKEIEFLPQLPKNASGKVLVNQLKNRK